VFRASRDRRAPFVAYVLHAGRHGPVCEPATVTTWENT
jgi:hypothetical protein